MFRKLCLPFLALALCLPAAAASAQEGQQGQADQATGDPQVEIDQTRARREQVTAELDLMRASDVELKAEAARLDGLVSEHSSRADLASLHLADVEASLGGLRVDLREAQRLADQRRAVLRARAIEAYMHPGSENLTTVLTSTDYGEAHRKASMLKGVADHDAAVLRGKQEAEAQLFEAERRYEVALGEADRLRSESESERLLAVEARDQQGAVVLALEQRIGEFQEEADALAEHEWQLTSLISARGATSLTTVPPSTTSSSSTTPPTTAAPSSTVPVTPPGPGQPAVTTTPTTPAPPPPPPTTTTTQAPKPGGYSLIWPTSGPLTSPYGMRWGRMHQGIDIGAPSGNAIVAASSGTVFFAGVMSGYGNVTLIDHFNGMVTVYAHQSAFAVGNGTRVSQGQVIGYVGSTGNSTGPHLHFETRVNGVALNPMAYL